MSTITLDKIYKCHKLTFPEEGCPITHRNDFENIGSGVNEELNLRNTVDKIIQIFSNFKNENAPINFNELLKRLRHSIVKYNRSTIEKKDDDPLFQETVNWYERLHKYVCIEHTSARQFNDPFLVEYKGKLRLYLPDGKYFSLRRGFNKNKRLLEAEGKKRIIAFKKNKKYIYLATKHENALEANKKTRVIAITNLNPNQKELSEKPVYSDQEEMNHRLKMKIQKEAEILKSHQHLSGFVTFEGILIYQNYAFLFEEFCNKKDLESCLNEKYFDHPDRSGKVKEKFISSLIQSIVDIHKQKEIHKDIKTCNIGVSVVNGKVRAKLFDVESVSPAKKPSSMFTIFPAEYRDGKKWEQVLALRKQQESITNKIQELDQNDPLIQQYESDRQRLIDEENEICVELKKQEKIWLKLSCEDKQKYDVWCLGKVLQELGCPTTCSQKEFDQLVSDMLSEDLNKRPTIFEVQNRWKSMTEKPSEIALFFSELFDSPFFKELLESIYAAFLALGSLYRLIPAYRP